MPSLSLSRQSLLWGVALLLVLAAGIFLRIHTFVAPKGIGSDEMIYCGYVDHLRKDGPSHYPALIDLYLQAQKAYPIVLLPPTRVTFILCAHVWRASFHTSSIDATRAVSCVASVAFFLLAGVFAWRARGPIFALALLVLMAPAPLQLYLAHWGLIDGFFAFVSLLVLWTLWEAMQATQRQSLWLMLYGGTLVLLVLTKENAAFVYAAILGLLVANRWLKMGRVTVPLWMVTLVAPVIGMSVLVLLAGGPERLVEVFQLNTAKSLVTPYAIANGDGPWFRYLLDLLLVTPAVLLLAIGGAFLLNSAEKAGWFLFGFLFFSYVGMSQVRYGMNLRYGAIWDFPLCFLALLALLHWARAIRSRVGQVLFLVVAVGLLAGLEFSQYLRIFVDGEVYDPIPADVLPALNILKG